MTFHPLQIFITSHRKRSRPVAIVLRITIFNILLLFADTGASQAEECDAHSKTLEVESVSASASSWGNLRNNPGSVRYESSRMLKKATTAAPPQAPADFTCPAGCTVQPAPQVIFQSVPAKFLSDYSEKPHCDDLKAQTSKKPLKYSDRNFPSADALSDWFGDFSQGKGTDGKDLYTRCDGACSPQYTCEIRRNSSKLLLNASVLCGPARDKDDNSYRLTLAYRWSCGSAASTASVRE